MKTILVACACTCAYVLGSSEARAEWVRCAEELELSAYSVSSDSSRLAHAEVAVNADGGSMRVHGGAVDVFGSFTEAGAGAAVSGAHYECWKFEPDEENVVGEIECKVELEIEGIAMLVDPNCAGLAAGYERADLFVDGNLRSSAMVMLDQAAGETVSGVLGPFGMKLPGPWGLTIPAAINLTFGTGAGNYKDEDQKSFVAVICPAMTLEYATQTRSIGRVWADEDLALEAVVAVRAKGQISTQISKLEFPSCPSGSIP